MLGLAGRVTDTAALEVSIMYKKFRAAVKFAFLNSTVASKVDELIKLIAEFISLTKVFLIDEDLKFFHHSNWIDL